MNMKKVIMILSMLIIGLTSCNKEVDANSEDDIVGGPCNCGIIVDNQIETAWTNGKKTQYIYVKNYCSDNIIKEVAWYVPQDELYNTAEWCSKDGSW